jgi:hypothetical protein
MPSEWRVGPAKTIERNLGVLHAQVIGMDLDDRHDHIDVMDEVQVDMGDSEIHRPFTSLTGHAHLRAPHVSRRDAGSADSRRRGKAAEATVRAHELRISPVA